LARDAAEFHKLHDYAIDAVRRALPTAKMGGPDVAGSGGKFTRDFLEHVCGNELRHRPDWTPIDFVSFHAKGSPITTNGYVRIGDRGPASNGGRGFRLIASYRIERQNDRHR